MIHLSGYFFVYHHTGRQRTVAIGITILSAKLHQKFTENKKNLKQVYRIHDCIAVNWHSIFDTGIFV